MNVLTQADPDVREILATIGDFSLSADTLEQLRGQPLRPAAPSSGAVEHTDYLVPGPSGGPDVPVRVHRPGTPAGRCPASTPSTAAASSWVPTSATAGSIPGAPR